jgi:hypothetical protein
MVTEFQGTRMANVSNKLVEDIFTDEDWEEASHHYEEAQREAIASIDNDCPYKVYPLYDSTSGELTGDMKQKAKTLMDKLMAKGFNKTAAAGIVGNMYCETSPKFDHTSVNGNDKGYIAGGLCQWNDGYYNLTNLINGKTADYGQKKNNGKDPLKVKDVKSKLAELGVDHQITFINDTISKVTVRGTKQTYSKDKLNQCKTARDAAKSFEYNYERSDGKNVNDRMNKAEEFYNAYDSTTTSNSSQPNQDVKKDIYTAFFNAVQKSLNSTTSACELKKEMYIKQNQFSDGIMMIKQVDGGTDKLPMVFDIILNGYYEYVQKLWWIYPENGLKGNPLHIDVTVVEKVNPQNRVVLAAETKKIQEAKDKKFGGDNTSVNDKLLKSILKKYKQVPNNEIPQFDSQDIFKDIQVQDCDTVMNSNSKEGALQKGSDISKGDAGSIDGWDVGEACRVLRANAKSSTQHACAKYVEIAIAAGGGPLKEKISTHENGGNTDHATNLRYYGILEKHGFIKIKEGITDAYGDAPIQLQSGDVAIIGKNAKIDGGKYHATMYCSEGWISDFRQKHMSPYKSNYPYAIYRFHNKMKS